jgi:hypothetical protein
MVFRWSLWVSSSSDMNHTQRELSNVDDVQETLDDWFELLDCLSAISGSCCNRELQLVQCFFFFPRDEG